MKNVGYKFAMKRMTILAAAVMLLSNTISVGAEESIPKEHWEGFRNFDSSDVLGLNLPFQGFIESSVLKYTTIGMTKAGESFQIIDVETEPETMSAQLLSGDSDLLPWQVETCRKQGIRYCPVLQHSNSGTTFFNNGRFLTCRHGFHNWLSLASQHNGNRPVNELSPPVRIYDRFMNLIYNSAQIDSPLIKFTMINDHPSLNVQTFNATWPTPEIARPVAQADYVEFNIDYPLVIDFGLIERSLGTYNLFIRDSVYGIGYPGRTFFPDGLGDTPGNKLVLSHGFVTYISPEYHLIGTSNFSVPGNSGGPVVTGSGTIVGVACRSTVSTDPSKVQTFFSPTGRDLLRAYWARIPYASNN